MNVTTIIPTQFDASEIIIKSHPHPLFNVEIEVNGQRARVNGHDIIKAIEKAKKIKESFR